MKHISAILLLLYPIIALAAPVTPEGALKRLSKQNLYKAWGVNQTPQYKVAEIMADSCGNNTVYLFDSEIGFVVSPADDLLPAVLGYGDSPMYDAAGNMPAGFREWLQYMSQRVTDATGYGYKITGIASLGEAIAPLCSTSWGQEEPYNLECPEYRGEKCLTGCTATAMAQVMKYHSWPPQGQGELEYYAQKISANIHTDFSQYAPDWDNMLDDYSASSATTEQKQAVAHLMRGLGGSTCMNYSPTASGADIGDAAQALVNYWDYSDDIRLVRRGWFTLRDWSQLLYDALKTYGPILYAGYSWESGHAFVCDGYDGEGLFHFNWGWDGNANGYFAIDFLNPAVDDQPTADGYNSSQTAVLNIHPRSPENPGTRAYDLWSESYYINPATGFGDRDTHTLHPGDNFQMNGSCINYGPFSIPGGSKFATIFTPLYDGEAVATNIIELTSDIRVYGSYDNNAKTVPDGLRDGIYSLKNDFYISPSGWGHNIELPICERGCALVANGGTDIRFIRAVYIPEIKHADFPDKIDLDAPTAFNATLCNTIPYDQERLVRVELIQDGIVKGWSPWAYATFEPEEKIDFTLTADKWTWTDESVCHTGEYILCLSVRNSYGDIWIPMGQGKKVSVSDSASIDALSFDGNSRSTMYDLQGRKVSNDADLSPGVYIRLNNGTASKTILLSE